MTEQIKIIRAEFRRSKEARYIHRLHGVLLVLLGRSTVEAGSFLGVPQRTIAHWVAQFKKEGLDGLKDPKRHGRPSMLTPRQWNALRAALKKSPADSGIVGDRWTGERVADFLRRKYGIRLTIRHSRRILRALEEGSH